MVELATDNLSRRGSPTRKALTQLREGEQLLERQAAQEYVSNLCGLG